MKKFLSYVVFAIMALNVMAQTPITNRIVVHKGNKIVAGYDMNAIDSLSFDAIGEIKANLSLVSTAANSAVVEIQRSADCASFLLAYEPASDWDGYGTVADRVKEIKHTELKVDGKQNLLSLRSGEIYNVYTLAFDKYGIEGETSMISMQVGTGDEDAFTVTLSDITCNNVGVKIQPVDQNMFYSWMLHTKEHYEDCIENHGNMNGWDKAWWNNVAMQTGVTWQEAMYQDITQGETDEPESDWLLWDTDYVVTVYGISEEDGTALTKTTVVPVHTKSPTPSSNNISVEIQNVYYDGVDVKVTTTNNDTYLVGSERKTYVDFYMANGEEAFLRQWINDVHENTTLIHSGNDEFKKTVKAQDTDYYLIVVGYNGGPTTTLQLIPFHSAKMF